ncbi:MAG: hypothetical protein CHACPFDD_03845 [Phycisphaerae bacterium]|nr:hypothetical protein [Phycisphaerae bacterium]
MKGIVYRLVEWLGVNRLFAWLNRRRVVILRYHGVAAHDARGEAWLSAPPLDVEEFRRQIVLLVRRYRVVPLDEAAAMLRGEIPLRPGCAAITFDDGYRNNATYAFPVLREHGVSGAFFLVTDFVDRGQPLWFDRLDFALARTAATQIEVGSNGTREVLVLGTCAERRATFERLKRRYKTMDLADVMPAIEQIEAAAGIRLAEQLDEEAQRAAPMTWDTARAMCAAGMCIGSHTVTHQILGRASADRMREEARRSREIIEQRLGEPCTLFAYPNGQPGDFNAESEAALRAAGYVCGLVTETGFAARGDNPLALRRISMGNVFDRYRLLAELSGFQAWILRVRDGLWPRRLGARAEGG